MESGSRTKTHVAVFSALGLGHVIPFTELARILALEHSCKVTIITLPWEPNSRQEILLTEAECSSSGLDIHLLPLPGIRMADIPRDESTKMETVISLVAEKAKPSFEAALRGLNDRVDAFIGDFFFTTLMDAATKLGIPSYLFFTSGMSLMTLMLSLPKLNEHRADLFDNPDVTVDIDGLPPLQRGDLLAALQDRTNEAFKWFVYHGRRYAEYRGIFVNTFDELEPKALQALRSGRGPFLPKKVPPVYAVGPVIPKKFGEYPEMRDCLDWLDAQAENSVLLMSFGSGTTPSKEQITELALGLKESGHTFLFILRPPGLAVTDVEKILPVGFLAETVDRGKTLLSWAPQMMVLGHPAVGGFFYHGGWNSTLESVWHGVPTVVLPMFAESTLNKEIVVREMLSGIGVGDVVGGVVKKDEVVRCVKELMEGDEGRKARVMAKELMGKARSAVSVGGSSYIGLDKAVSMLRGGDATVDV